MPRQISLEQHQLLETLSGKQYTRKGTPRKTQRHYNQTQRLGLAFSDLDFDQMHKETAHNIPYWQLYNDWQ
jgi:hypothetical protein